MCSVLTQWYVLCTHPMFCALCSPNILCSVLTQCYVLRGENLLRLVNERKLALEEMMSDDSASSCELDDMEDDLDNAHHAYLRLVAEPVYRLLPLNRSVFGIDDLDDQSVGTDFRFRSKVQSPVHLSSHHHHCP